MISYHVTGWVMPSVIITFPEWFFPFMVCNSITEAIEEAGVSPWHNDIVLFVYSDPLYYRYYTATAVETPTYSRYYYSPFLTSRRGFFKIDLLFRLSDYKLINFINSQLNHPIASCNSGRDCWLCLWNLILCRWVITEIQSTCSQPIMTWPPPPTP